MISGPCRPQRDAHRVAVRPAVTSPRSTGVDLAACGRTARCPPVLRSRAHAAMCAGLPRDSLVNAQLGSRASRCRRGSSVAASYSAGVRYTVVRPSPTRTMSPRLPGGASSPIGLPSSRVTVDGGAVNPRSAAPGSPGLLLPLQPVPCSPRSGARPTDGARPTAPEARQDAAHRATRTSTPRRRRRRCPPRSATRRSRCRCKRRRGNDRPDNPHARPERPASR